MTWNDASKSRYVKVNEECLDNGVSELSKNVTIEEMFDPFVPASNHDGKKYTNFGSGFDIPANQGLGLIKRCQKKKRRVM